MNGGIDRVMTRPRMAWTMALLMIMSVFAMIPMVAPADQGTSSRAWDDETEPNNNYAEANLIQSGDIVNGSLDWNTDKNDVFKIYCGRNDILNVSFVQKQYNAGNPDQYSMDIEVLGPLPQHALIRREVKKTIVDTVSAFCVEQGEYFIWLYIRDGSSPVDYTVNGIVSTLTGNEIQRGDHFGSLDASNTVSGTNPYTWYKVDIPPEKGLQVTLDVPPGADFDMDILLQWDKLDWFYPGHKNPLWLNVSNENATDNFEFMKATAYDGAYYIKLKAWPGSKGTYKLTVIDFDPVDSDNNNLAGEAIMVDRKGTSYGHLHQSFDHFDWYKVFLTKDQTINITMSLLTNTGDIYNMSIYDSTLNYITGAFDTTDGNWYNVSNPIDSECEVVNFVAPATDYYYIMVMPVRNPTSYDQNPFIPCDSDYKIVWDLPNKGAERYANIQDITMSEDTAYTGLNLYSHFRDADGLSVPDPLTFSYESSNANLTVAIEQATGAVTLTPASNWNTGDDQITITFKAEDPLANTGPLMATAEAKVKVLPVNDPPTVTGELDPVTMDEDEEKVLENISLYDHFKDIDDPTLLFTVVDNGSVPVVIDDETGGVTLGPVTGWYGTKEINITGTDSGDQKAHIMLNVTVGHVNHGPTVADDQNERALTIGEDATNVSVLVTPWFNDVDAGYTSDKLTFKVGTPLPVNLMATMEEGALKIIPLDNWTGEEPIWVVATDTYKQEAKVRLTVNVTPVNDAPVILATNPAGAIMSANEGQVVELEVTNVLDVDTNETLFKYIWYLNDELLDDGSAKLDLLTDFDPATSTVSAGTHKVKVEVSDGELYDTFEWELTIYDVNQGPRDLVILSPTPGQKFKHNQVIVLKADNATDIDADALTYTWKDNATGEVLGKNQTLELKKLKKGVHVVILEVTDGKGGSNTTTIEFTVKAKPKKEPGFGLVLYVMATVVALFVARARGRKGKGRAL